MARVVRAWHRRRRRGFVVLALVVLAVVAVLVVRGRYWSENGVSVPSPTSTVAVGGTPRFDVARAQLAALPVKGWDRAEDFERYRFGEAWSDERMQRA